MTINVTHNPNNSYTITCGGETVTVGGDPPPPPGGSGGMSAGGGTIGVTSTTGGVTASIVESPEGRRVGLEVIKADDFDPNDAALWLQIETATLKPIPIRIKDCPITVGWKGRKSIDVGKLGIQMKELGIASPLLIRGLPRISNK